MPRKQQFVASNTGEGHESQPPSKKQAIEAVATKQQPPMDEEREDQLQRIKPLSRNWQNWVHSRLSAKEEIFRIDATTSQGERYTVIKPSVPILLASDIIVDSTSNNSKFETFVEGDTVRYFLQDAMEEKPQASSIGGRAEKVIPISKVQLLDINTAAVECLEESMLLSLHFLEALLRQSSGLPLITFLLSHPNAVARLLRCRPPSHLNQLSGAQSIASMSHAQFFVTVFSTLHRVFKESAFHSGMDSTVHFFLLQLASSTLVVCGVPAVIAFLENYQDSSSTTFATKSIKNCLEFFSLLKQAVQCLRTDIPVSLMELHQHAVEGFGHCLHIAFQHHSKSTSTMIDTRSASTSSVFKKYFSHHLERFCVWLNRMDKAANHVLGIGSETHFATLLPSTEQIVPSLGNVAPLDASRRQHHQRAAQMFNLPEITTIQSKFSETPLSKIPAQLFKLERFSFFGTLVRVLRKFYHLRKNNSNKSKTQEDVGLWRPLELISSTEETEGEGETNNRINNCNTLMSATEKDVLYMGTVQDVMPCFQHHPMRTAMTQPFPSSYEQAQFLAQGYIPVVLQLTTSSPNVISSSVVKNDMTTTALITQQLPSYVLSVLSITISKEWYYFWMFISRESLLATTVVTSSSSSSNHNNPNKKEELDVYLLHHDAATLKAMTWSSLQTKQQTTTNCIEEEDEHEAPQRQKFIPIISDAHLFVDVRSDEAGVEGNCAAWSHVSSFTRQLQILEQLATNSGPQSVANTSTNASASATAFSSSSSFQLTSQQSEMFLHHHYLRSNGMEFGTSDTASSVNSNLSTHFTNIQKEELRKSLARVESCHVKISSGGELQEGSKSSPALQIALDPSQAEVLHGIGQYPFRVVEGVAGSGKTITAAVLASGLAAFHSSQLQSQQKPILDALVHLKNEAKTLKDEDHRHQQRQSSFADEIEQFATSKVFSALTENFASQCTELTRYKKLLRGKGTVVGVAPHPRSCERLEQIIEGIMVATTPKPLVETAGTEHQQKLIRLSDIVSAASQRALKAPLVNALSRKLQTLFHAEMGLLRQLFVGCVSSAEVFSKHLLSSKQSEEFQLIIRDAKEEPMSLLRRLFPVLTSEKAPLGEFGVQKRTEDINSANTPHSFAMEAPLPHIPLRSTELTTRFSHRSLSSMTAADRQEFENLLAEQFMDRLYKQLHEIRREKQILHFLLVDLMEAVIASEFQKQKCIVLSAADVLTYPRIISGASCAALIIDDYHALPGPAQLSLPPLTPKDAFVVCFVSPEVQTLQESSSSTVTAKFSQSIFSLQSTLAHRLYRDLSSRKFTNVDIEAAHRPLRVSYAGRYLNNDLVSIINSGLLRWIPVAGPKSKSGSASSFNVAKGGGKTTTSSYSLTEKNVIRINNNSNPTGFSVSAIANGSLHQNISGSSLNSWIWTHTVSDEQREIEGEIFGDGGRRKRSTALSQNLPFLLELQMAQCLVKYFVECCELSSIKVFVPSWFAKQLRQLLIKNERKGGNHDEEDDEFESFLCSCSQYCTTLEESYDISVDVGLIVLGAGPSYPKEYQPDAAWYYRCITRCRRGFYVMGHSLTISRLPFVMHTAKAIDQIIVHNNSNSVNGPSSGGSVESGVEGNAETKVNVSPGCWCGEGCFHFSGGSNDMSTAAVGSNINMDNSASPLLISPAFMLQCPRHSKFRFVLLVGAQGSRHYHNLVLTPQSIGIGGSASASITLTPTVLNLMSTSPRMKDYDEGGKEEENSSTAKASNKEEISTSSVACCTIVQWKYGACQSACLQPFQNCSNPMHKCIQSCHEGRHGPCQLLCGKQLNCGHICTKSCCEMCFCEKERVEKIKCRGQAVVAGYSQQEIKYETFSHYEVLKCGQTASELCTEPTVKRCPACYQLFKDVCSKELPAQCSKCDALQQKLLADAKESSLSRALEVQLRKLQDDSRLRQGLLEKKMALEIARDGPSTYPLYAENLERVTKMEDYEAKLKEEYDSVRANDLKEMSNNLKASLLKQKRYNAEIDSVEKIIQNEVQKEVQIQEEKILKGGREKIKK